MSATPAGLLDLLACTGRGVLLLSPGALDGPLREAAAGWGDRVTAAAATPDALPGSPAVLVRPDGHAAWVAPTGQRPEVTAEALRDTITADFGPRSASAGER